MVCVKSSQFLQNAISRLYGGIIRLSIALAFFLATESVFRQPKNIARAPAIWVSFLSACFSRIQEMSILLVIIELASVNIDALVRNESAFAGAIFRALKPLSISRGGF